MGTVFRKTFTKAVPPGATITERKGGRVAEWRDAKGRKRKAAVTTGTGGADRLLIEAGTFTAKYRDAAGVVREVATGCRDETAARQRLADLERRVELVRAGVVTAGEDAVAEHAVRPLGEHIDAFLAHQRAKGVCKTQFDNTASRLRRLAADCRWNRLGDLKAESFEAWLTARREEGMGAVARNGFREAATTFANWCVRGGRLSRNPFSRVPKADERADPRRQRRALTEDELTRLLYVATWRPLAEQGRATIRLAKPTSKQSRDGWTYQPLDLESLPAALDRARGRLKGDPDRLAKLERQGRERALVYKMAAVTGLRRGELASLTVGSLRLDDATPHVTLAAGAEKNREGNSVPLRADLAGDLRAWLAVLQTVRQDAARRAPTLRLDPKHPTPRSTRWRASWRTPGGVVPRRDGR